MKKAIISIATIIGISLILTLIYYQNSEPTLPTDQLVQQNKTPQTQQEPEPLQPIGVTEKLGYSLQNDEVQMTYDKGETWMKVPIEKQDLFEITYRGNEQELEEGSFIFSEELTGFLYSKAGNIVFHYSRDKGETWQEAIVRNSPFPMRFRKIDFIDSSFGYAIFTGDKAMSQEESFVYLTFNGGETWQKTNHPGVTRLIADGGFVDHQTGFLSFGILNPDAPELHVSQDGGNSWTKAQINMPNKYDRIFVIAEVPFIEDDHLALLIHQGPSGDYMGGKVKGKFISKDNGLTWEFLMEVEPNEEA